MVEIRLIETATATFNEAAYEKAEGDSFEVTVTLGEAFVETEVTLPVSAFFTVPPVTVKAWSRRVL